MIVLDNLSVSVGDFSLTGISFEIPSGAYGALMGRTASGKTTILETVCGLKHALDGRIILDGRDITRLKAAERGIGYVPQDGALFSTMTVSENLAFALVIRKRSPAEIESRVEELALLLGISELLDRLPLGLSGGERQRVALGRALAARPSILCLDEPLSSLDEETRQEMCDLLKTVCHETGVSTLHITHSMPEALDLAHHIFRIENGTIRDMSHLVNGNNS